ncbi:MAG: hypothetical protein ABR558_08455, partial [Thioalkalivibrio sp.]
LQYVGRSKAAAEPQRRREHQGMNRADWQSRIINIFDRIHMIYRIEDLLNNHHVNPVMIFSLRLSDSAANTFPTGMPSP